MRLSIKAIAGVALSLAAVPMLFSMPACSMFQQKDVTAVAVTDPGTLPGLQDAGLHQVWQRGIRMEAGEQVKKAWYVGRSIYVATTESRLLRIDPKNGVITWAAGLGRENFDIYKPIELMGADSRPTKEVLVVTRGEAFVFDIETGDETRIPARLGISVSADPVVIGNTLCVGGADTFYGLYLDRLGAKHWRLPVPGDLFLSAPVALDSNVLVASKSGHIWRIDGNDGNWDWKDRKTNGDVMAGIAADVNAVYVPSLDQRVYAFRTDTGGELWEQYLEGRLEDTPALAGPVVLQRTLEGTLYALLRTTGVVQWKLPDIAHIATVGQKSVWVVDTAGNLKSISLEDGHQLTSAPAPGVKLYLKNTLDSNVVLVTAGGLVGMYAPADAGK